MVAFNYNGATSYDPTGTYFVIVLYMYDYNTSKYSAKYTSGGYLADLGSGVISNIWTFNVSDTGFTLTAQQSSSYKFLGYWFATP